MNTPDATLEAAIMAGRIEPGMSFHQRVWAACARIPKGRVATYGDLARCVGSPRAFRAVGQAMNRNPYSPRVPCHRVVGSDGSLTGFASGLDRKIRLLRQEGITFRPAGRGGAGRTRLEKVNLAAHRWRQADPVNHR